MLASQVHSHVTGSSKPMPEKALSGNTTVIDNASSFRGDTDQRLNPGCQPFALHGLTVQLRYMLRRPRLAFCAAACAVLATVGLLVTNTATGNSSTGFQPLIGSHVTPTPLANESKATEWLLAYHAYTEQSCANLLSGDTAEQARVNSLVARARASGLREFPCYRDDYLSYAPCDELRATVTSGYTATPEELAFPLAYELRVHTCATQVELLLRAVYAPHNFYCLHVDGGSPPSFKAAMTRLAKCLPNVRLARFDSHFVYSSASQMNADLECMRVARASPVKWRYFINLAGQELPLKTNLELVRFFRGLNGSSHFHVHNNTSPDRQERSHWCINNVTGIAEFCLPPYARKPPPPRNVTVYKSYSNGAFSRAFVDYLLDDEFARELYLWFNDTLCPEEHYFATLLALPEAPGGGAWGGILERSMIWSSEYIYGNAPCAGQFVRLICVFVSADLPRLVKQPEPFVNKLHFQEDPFAVRCLAGSIIERRRKQNAGLLN